MLEHGGGVSAGTGGNEEATLHTNTGSKTASALDSDA